MVGTGCGPTYGVLAGCLGSDRLRADFACGLLEFREGPMGLWVQRTAPVEAVQWFKDGDHPAVRRDHPQSRAYVITLMGKRAYVEPGDWILKDLVDGRYWPINRVMFEKRYEPYVEG